MSWPTAAIWAQDTKDVRAEIAELASTIVQFEPVTLLASSEDAADATSQCDSAVEILTLPVDDLWARDTIPVFITGADGSGTRGIDFNFNGWGGKQEHARDAKVAAALLTELGIPRIEAPLVAEGGSFETNGEGTLLVTRSSLLNDNRNPGLSQEQAEAQLRELLGMDSIIWFDGVYGQDITDAHVDCLARFVSPSVVVLDVPGPGAPDDVWAQASSQARTVLEQAKDVAGAPFTLVDLPQPDVERIRGEGDDFLSSYVNFYIANGAVLLPEFGDEEADAHARDTLQQHFPDREVIAMNIDTIASGGGGIHCATHDLPRQS